MMHQVCSAHLLTNIEPAPDPLMKYAPARYTSEPHVLEYSVVVPTLKPPASILDSQTRLELDEYATDIYEWLSMVRLQSPRLNPDDKIDPYLSSYAIPASSTARPEGPLTKITWEGFISPAWTRRLLAEVILGLPAKSWFSLSASSFVRNTLGDCTECTVLRPPDSAGEYFLWDIKGHE
jgi:ribonucleases P/MRP protein subunit RPP40